MKKGQMLIITAVVMLVSLGAVLMWNEGGITKEVTVGQTQADIFETFALGQTINNYLEDSAEIALCNAMHLTGSNWNKEALPEEGEISEGNTWNKNKWVPLTNEDEVWNPVTETWSWPPSTRRGTCVALNYNPNNEDKETPTGADVTSFYSSRTTCVEEYSCTNKNYNTENECEGAMTSGELLIKEYFEERYQDNLAVYIADFPPIKKTSLEDEYALYTNLFFHSEFDYENKIIKGGPDKVIYNHAYGYDPVEEESLYETVEFVDYLEILSDDGYVYKLRPLYSINFPTEFFDHFESVRSWTSGTPEGFESIENEKETIPSTEEGVEDTTRETGRVLAVTDLRCLGKNVEIIFTP